MVDYNAIAAQLTSPDAFLALTDEPNVHGAQQKAQAAHELWASAEERFVGAVAPMRAPGGTGTGLVIHVYWNPAEVAPDLPAIQAAINTAVPVKMIKAENKAAWKARDKKQAGLFFWRGMRSRPLSQWFQERFGVSACASVVFDASDFGYNVAAVAVKDGVDHLWTFTVPK
jgi:hypothetical protein